MTWIDLNECRLRRDFGESSGAVVGAALSESDAVLSSVLTLLDSRRALVRGEKDGMLTASEAAHLHGIVQTLGNSWHLMEVTPEVRERASSPFPVEPIRSLDAIHLSTALVFAVAFTDIRVLSLEKRITDNLPPLGLS